MNTRGEQLDHANVPIQNDFFSEDSESMCTAMQWTCVGRKHWAENKRVGDSTRLVA